MPWHEQKMTELEAQPIFESSGGAAAEPAFRTVESELGRALPADYKEFAARYGQWSFAGYVAVPIPGFQQGGICQRE